MITDRADFKPIFSDIKALALVFASFLAVIAFAAFADDDDDDDDFVTSTTSSTNDNTSGDGIWMGAAAAPFIAGAVAKAR